MDVKGVGIDSAGTSLVSKILTVGIDGLGPFKGAREVADEHLKQHGDPDKAIKRMIATHGAWSAQPASSRVSVV